ncbi:hypothetical protein AB0N42_24580, partial [Streptomyces pseudogriseolus]|uniref:hypothetical protein n=1 Tax=Streptomyces pseudogriseolus TaxID=36817 RepID=UPI00349943B0
MFYASSLLGKWGWETCACEKRPAARERDRPPYRTRRREPGRFDVTSPWDGRVVGAVSVPTEAQVEEA